MADAQSELNSLGQPVGLVVSGWSPRPLPPDAAMHGRLVRLERLDATRHAADLHAANASDADAGAWTYLPYGPFADLPAYRGWVEGVAAARDPLFFAIIDSCIGRATGVASLMRADPANGSMEIGHIRFSRVLARTPAATDAIYLLMRRAFDELGYRRLEWKCDALNAPSRAAALRLGFSFEGIFRQAVVVKGRNRDTAWYSIIDREWPLLRGAIAGWLSQDNVGVDGRSQQRRRLSDLRAEARVGTPVPD